MKKWSRWYKIKLMEDVNVNDVGSIVQELLNYGVDRVMIELDPKEIQFQSDEGRTVMLKIIAKYATKIKLIF